MAACVAVASLARRFATVLMAGNVPADLVVRQHLGRRPPWNRLAVRPLTRSVGSWSPWRSHHFQHRTGRGSSTTTPEDFFPLAGKKSSAWRWAGTVAPSRGLAWFQRLGASHP